MLRWRTASKKTDRLVQFSADLLLIASAEGGTRCATAPAACACRRSVSTAAWSSMSAGPGFPEGFLPQAFERFSRPPESRSGGGAGLGLAIVSVVAKAHGTTGAWNDSLNGGAGVWLAIPDRR